MRTSSSEPPKPAIESFLPPTPVQEMGNLQQQPSASVEPPDVSQLTPAEAEKTLADWNYDRQDWQHAIDHYQQAISRGADTPDVRTDMGNCHRFLNQPQQALEQYQIAQNQNPQHENSLFNQISLYAQFLHDPDNAKKVARDFLVRFPNSPRADVVRKQLSTMGDASAN
jgi:tetratricopeptide (TPR) repeat protein